MLEMKLIMMAAALMLGGAAVAQTTEDDTETTTTTTTTTAPAEAEAPMTTAMPMSSSTGQTVAPDNSAPERDARGIPVVSAPAVAPAGFYQPAQMVPAGTAPPAVAAAPAASMGTAGPLPPCTRTVTDHCTQTYERGRAH
jgi:hypothetical protein